MTTKVEGDELVIRIPLKVPGSLSKTGKMLLVASTGGFVGVPGTDLRLSLNLGRKP